MEAVMWCLSHVSPHATPWGSSFSLVLQFPSLRPLPTLGVQKFETKPPPLTNDDDRCVQSKEKPSILTLAPHSVSSCASSRGALSATCSHSSWPIAGRPSKDTPEQLLRKRHILRSPSDGLQGARRSSSSSSPSPPSVPVLGLPPALPQENSRALLQMYRVASEGIRQLSPPRANAPCDDAAGATTRVSTCHLALPCAAPPDHFHRRGR